MSFQQHTEMCVLSPCGAQPSACNVLDGQHHDQWGSVRTVVSTRDSSSEFYLQKHYYSVPDAVLSQLAETLSDEDDETAN